MRMGRLSSVLVTGFGVLLLALLVLSVVGTVVGIALSIIAAVFAMIVTGVVLSVFVLAAVGLFSVLSHNAATDAERHPSHRSTSHTDPEARLRARYVDGELDEGEFERELERILGPDQRRDRPGMDLSSTRDSATDRRLRDR